MWLWGGIRGGQCCVSSYKRLPGMQGAGVLCLMDIAAGMEHLHSLGVLHVSIPRSALPHGLACRISMLGRQVPACSAGLCCRPPKTVPGAFLVPASPEEERLLSQSVPPCEGAGPHTSRSA